MSIFNDKTRRIAALAAAFSVFFTAAAPSFAAPADRTVELTPGISTAGRLESPVDVDYYSVTLPEPGCVAIDLASEGDGSWQAELLSGDQVMLTQQSSEDSVEIGLDSGEYLIRVTPDLFSAEEYSLTVSLDLSAGWETEFNDGPALADELPAQGVISGSVSRPDDRDCYTFTLSADRYVALDFRTDSVQPDGWLLSLRDQAGKEIFGTVTDGEDDTRKLSLSAGQYYIEICAAEYSPASYKLSLSELNEAQIVRLGGSTRIQTAVEISRAGWAADGAESVVIANAYNFPDALAGETLAAALNAPILLTAGKNATEPQIIEEIKRLGAQKVYILGGEGVVSASIAEELEQLAGSVERLCGSDRYGTALAIALRITGITGGVSTVYFASGKDFPDALSISPVAALSGGIILYMPQDGELGSDVTAFLRNLGCTDAVIIGGTSAVSEESERRVRELGFSTERIGGTDRYDTSTKICSRYSRLFSGTAIAAAAGTTFPDALAGGVFAAARSMPVVLVTDPLPAKVISYVSSIQPESIYVFGGTSAVTQEAADRLAQA